MANFGAGAKGAAGGAAVGTAILPGWGTAIGAGIGGLMGLFGGDDNDAQKQALDDFRKQVQSRTAPEEAAPSVAATSAFRDNQTALANRLEALANGTGPSIAGAQLAEATDRNMANQASLAQGGRGNPALAAIVASNNMQQLGQQSAQQAVVARLAEQQQANQLLSSVLGQGRAADEQNAQFNAQQQNYVNQANLESKLRTMGLNDNAILAALGQQNTVNQQPTFGDQLLAGGSGALGMWAANRAQSGAANRAGAGGVLLSLAQQYPHGGDGPVTSTTQSY
jgi:hypothetical protein